MFEKVNPSHPDKIADRIAGALVDYAYTQEKNPKVAIEVLLGHKNCMIIAESSVNFPFEIYKSIVDRIAGIGYNINMRQFKQDTILANNQKDGFKCGDNGIFKGCPITKEEQTLTNITNDIYTNYPTDGKYILNEQNLIICHSNLQSFDEKILKEKFCDYDITINPLGFWTGSPDVDAGATNRKLGSDMGQSITGGGLHGKDFSKADVSVNIYCWLEAQRIGKPIEHLCSIGDDNISGISYSTIVEIAREYINNIGGFEKFAEWGLIRPNN